VEGLHCISNGKRKNNLMRMKEEKEKENIIERDLPET
jgi:hypothetical protein